MPGLGYGSAGKFFSLLVIQLGLWIRCIFHGKHKVYRANKALMKQLRFAFLSYLSVFLHYARSFAGNHCHRIE